jgi:hypothetical protein
VNARKGRRENMRNVTTKVEGSKLTIICDLDAPTVASKSGKSQVIASTEGNASIQTPKGAVKLGINLYR